MKRYLLPLIAFAVLVGFLAIGLRLKPSEIPSPFIGKPAPSFSLPTLAAPDKQLSVADLRGQIGRAHV